MQAGFDTFARFTPGWTAPDETTPDHVAHAAARFADPTAYAAVSVDDAGELDGVVCWRPPDPDRASADGWRPDAHLHWLFVAESRWGDGLARRLHGLAVAAMSERGVRTARLNTPAGQARSRAFYEREGWRPRLAPVVDERMRLALVEYGLALP